MKKQYFEPLETSHIQLSTTYWIKDSHGLYDYQAPSEQYKKETFYIDEQTKIFRDATNSKTIIKALSAKGRNPSKNVHVGNILINKNSLGVSYAFAGPPQNKSQQEAIEPYEVIQKESQTYPGYPLKPGNIIKLGRVQMTVIEVRNNIEVQSIRDTMEMFQNTGQVVEIKKAEADSQAVCKICWQNNSDLQNPLMTPCRCKGTCSFIHLDCLKKWINSKVKKQRSGIVTSYNFNKLQCQICKATFSNFMNIEGSTTQMMSIEKPDRPYLMLQTTNNKSDVKEQRTLQVITPHQNYITKIGRGHTCEVRVNDISVSRNHCSILFQNNQFYLRDTQSKFGTLVKFTDKNQTIQADKPLKIQVGRALMQFYVKGQPSDIDTC